MDCITKAIVVLGKRLQPDGTAPPLLRERVIYAIELYNKQPDNAIIIVTGGATVPGAPTEAQVMRQILIEQRISDNKILCEERAEYTAENAVYVRDILESTYPHVKEIMVVTSELHVERASVIFYSVFSAEFYPPNKVLPKIVFYGSANTGMTENEVHAERTREQLYVKEVGNHLKRYGFTPIPSGYSTDLIKNKFQPNRRPEFFPGVTMVCQVPVDAPQFKLLEKARSMIKKSAIADHYAFLPPSSFHMTVYDILANAAPLRPRMNKFSVEAENLEWYERNTAIMTSLRYTSPHMNWIVPNMMFDKMSHRATLVELRFASDRQEKVMRDFRTEVLKTLTGDNITSHYRSDYVFHITIAYSIKDFTTAEANNELTKLRTNLNKLFAKDFGTIELEPPRITRFHDMTEFIPLNGEQDMTLLLGYNENNGDAQLAHLSTYGKFIETKEGKWTSGWNFAPFKHKGECYYIAYKKISGKLNLTNRKSAAISFDIFSIDFFTGYSSMIITSHVDGFENSKFVIFYNSETGAVLVSKIHIEETKSRLEFIKKYKIGSGFSNLHKCEGGFVIGTIHNSTQETPLTIFRVKNGVDLEIVSTSTLPLKNADIIPLSTLDEETPQILFLSYSQFSDNNNTILLNSLLNDGKSGQTIATLSAQIPSTGVLKFVQLRFDSRGYIAVYEQANGNLHLFKLKIGLSNLVTFTKYQTHVIGPNFTRMVMFDRQFDE